MPVATTNTDVRAASGRSAPRPRNPPVFCDVGQPHGIGEQRSHRPAGERAGRDVLGDAIAPDGRDDRRDQCEVDGEAADEGRQARPRIFAIHQRSPTSRNRQSWKNSGGLPSTA